MNGKGTYTADRMANEVFDLVGLDHGCLLMKPFFVLMVIDTGIAGKDDEDRLISDQKRHGLGNAPAFRMKGAAASSTVALDSVSSITLSSIPHWEK